jgi:hypothetical protein
VKKFLSLLACFLFGSCSSPDKSVDRMKTAPRLTVSVLQSGKILVDGRETPLRELGEQLAQLKAREGVVWYYREASHDEPPPEAMEVVKMVVENQLPITLSSKPDFSDYIGPDGLSHPRDR